MARPFYFFEKTLGVRRTTELMRVKRRPSGTGSVPVVVSPNLNRGLNKRLAYCAVCSRRPQATRSLTFEDLDIGIGVAGDVDRDRQSLEVGGDLEATCAEERAADLVGELDGIVGGLAG